MQCWVHNQCIHLKTVISAISIANVCTSESMRWLSIDMLSLIWYYLCLIQASCIHVELVLCWHLILLMCLSSIFCNLQFCHFVPSRAIKTPYKGQVRFQLENLVISISFLANSNRFFFDLSFPLIELWIWIILISTCATVVSLDLIVDCCYLDFNTPRHFSFEPF